jgi:hypothetical protein
MSRKRMIQMINIQLNIIFIQPMKRQYKVVKKKNIENFAVYGPRLMGPPEENLIPGSDPAVLSSTHSFCILHSHLAHRSTDYCPAL